MYLSPRDTFGLFNAPKVSSVLWGPGVTQLVGENPDRVCLVLVNTGTAVFNVSPEASVATNSGLSLSAAGGQVTWVNRDHGPLSQVAWFANITGPGGRALIIEVVLERYPAPGTG